MHNRVKISLRIITIVFLLSLSNLNAQPARICQSQLHQIRIRDSDARRQEALHRRVCAEGYRATLSHRDHPGPYRVDNYRVSLGPSETFQKKFFIFVYQDVRGRYLSHLHHHARGWALIDFPSTQSYAPAPAFLCSSTPAPGHSITIRSAFSRLPSPNVSVSSDCER